MRTTQDGPAAVLDPVTDPVTDLLDDPIIDPVLESDAARARALSDYGVLEGPERRELVALVALAARVCGVPMAALNLFTATDQHQVATVGFEGSVSPRSDSMCDAVLDDPAPVVLADASLDDRFRDNPWVTGPAHVRFWATHQLVTPASVAIGTLCVFDSEPREVDDEQVAALADLAARVVDVLELELVSRRLALTVDQLRRSEEELQRSNRELAVLAGQVSHDLRSPLSAVMSNLEAAEAALATVPSTDRAPGSAIAESRAFLDRGRRAGTRMAALLGGTLANATLGGRRRATPVDLSAVVEAVLADLADALDAGLGTHLEVGPLPVVLGDEQQLQVVLANLVGNAVKFARPGAPARVQVQAVPVPQGWRIQVVDHGRGVADEHDDLFRPFVRGVGSVGVEGTGLGLATCRRIVHAHDGRIGLDPTPSGGATAWFELPGVAEPDGAPGRTTH